MWQHLAIGVSLMLVVEGVIPFLYPRRWKSMVETLARVDDRTMRIMGLISMLLGLGLLYLVH